jgi:phage-related protein
LKTFAFTPKSEVKRSVRYLDRTIEFESGAFQVQEVGVNPIITFQMTFESIAAEMAAVEAFYLEHRKSKRFYFNYNGEQFGSDGIELSAHAISAPDHVNVQGRQFSNAEFNKMSVELTLRVVNL